MRLPDSDLVTADAGAILLDLASRVQSLPLGPVMAAAIRHACMKLPLVLDAEVELAPAGPVEVGCGGRWSHRYELGPGPDPIGVLRLKVSDIAAFAPVEAILRDAVGLLGLSIAYRRTRDALRTELAERGEKLEEHRAEVERQRAENARLAEVVRHSNNPMYVMDLDYRVVWTNQAFLDTFGLTWGEIIGRRPSAILYGRDDAPELKADIRAALAANGFYYGEVANRNRHGEERIYSLHMDRFRSADGRHEGYVSIREDITERRRTELALAESEARFRELTASASDWFWETDADHHLVSLTGEWPHEGRPSIIGRCRWDFAIGDLQSEHWRRHFDDIENRRPFRDFRYALRRPNGSVGHVSISGRPAFDAAGRFVGYRGTGRDLTVEVQARETVDRMIRALNALDDLVALFDAEERLVFANRLYERMHPGIGDVLRPGATMAQLLDAFAELGIIEDPERSIPERLDRFRTPKGPFDMRRFGRWFRANEQKLEDGSTILIATDVTQAKEAELELRRAKEMAERADAAKSSFLARMSHELRTPLNAILGLSETLILMETRLSSQKRREYLSDILQAGRILLSHIDDILNFTRLEAGGFPVHPRPIDPRRAVAEAVRLMRAVARSRSIRLEADLARSLPFAYVDPRSLRQILVNLLSNAVKFSPTGGVVRLSVVRDDGRLCFSVIDNGIGIPADQQEKIFEPFHQVGEASLVAREGGTGLGLSIVKALVERNDGTISVQSVPTEGTTISVRLPVAAGEAVSK